MLAEGKLHEAARKTFPMSHMPSIVFPIPQAEDVSEPDLAALHPEAPQAPLHSVRGVPAEARNTQKTYLKQGLRTL